MNEISKPFIVLMAFLMSLTALAIDAILPALGSIRTVLNIVNENDAQFIISFVFLGMGIGLFFYGPLSDAWGRKRPLYLGLIIFILGSILSIVSESMEVMLLGRFLQGFGTAACRVVSVAMIRDKSSGPEMGKVMSLIMMVFIFVPAVAPAFGQLILNFAEWRYIFVSFVILGIVAFIILWKVQKETLKKSDRIPLSFKSLVAGSKETLLCRKAMLFTIASGITSGAFVSYLALSQQIFQTQLGVGDKFSYYFGFLALFIGTSSFINSKIVLRFGLLKPSVTAILALLGISGSFLIYFLLFGFPENIFSVMAFLCLAFLFIGILFGNLSTIAIEPLGHIAGIANSVISSIQTLTSVIIGTFIGHFYAGSIIPLVLGFFITSLVALGLIILFHVEDDI